MKKAERARKVVKLAAAVAVMSILVLSLASCGGSDEDTSRAAGEDIRLPPGITEESLEETTGSGLTLQGEEEEPAEEREETLTTSAPTGVSTDLDGARFTVEAATRPGSNEDVTSSGQRVVEGDYLEVELAIENIGDELVDISDYSFRLWSPGIDANQYEDYYGRDGTYGKYISENIISATLLDYVTLQPVGYKLKKGETVDGVFLFFDLNPQSTARNEGVIKDGTNLIIHNTGSGEEVEMNLAAFPD
jgi:hypothetical protein